ncbi:aldo/keto reductase [Selenomonas sp. AE3005]|uniref:aldo/keto reductase n=1 Tax=Selenomonas sp. AE3005 TaxID=1485543 RepID=UPI000482BAB5|nr:aldo/keto reductase [Selenomonas sp. AE3005]
MSKLCLGTVQFGMKYGVNNALGRQPDKEECYEIIEKALNSGISCFDTASAYGTAESLLGEFSWGRLTPHIISKLSPECPNDDKAVAMKIRKSLQRLSLTKLYGYMLHRGADMQKDAVMAGMVAAKEQGLVEKIGVSIYEPEEALQAVDDNRVDIIQIPYNVLDKRLDKAGFFVKAKKNNKEIYARSSFLQGLLLMKPDEAEKRVPQSGRFIAEFQTIAKAQGYTPTEAAMLYSLCNEGIDYVVFGVETLGQLVMNLSIQKKVDGFSSCYKDFRRFFLDVPREIIVPSLWR